MSIYATIGGPEAVSAAVDRLYERLLADPDTAPFFDEVDLGRLKGHQRAFLSAALGGPRFYEGRDLAAAHAHLDIDDADFDAVVAHLVATLEELDVLPEVIAEVGAALLPLRSQIVGTPVEQRA